MNRLLSKLTSTIFMVLCMCCTLLSSALKAQISETEPNNNITDVGVQTIAANGSYSGSYTFTDLEYYKLVPGSSGTITVTFNTAPAANGIYLAVYPGNTAVASTQKPNSFTYTLDPAVSYVIYTGTGTATGAWQFSISGLVVPTLPVTLSSFTARIQDNAALMEWGTSSETNNKHFLIERSTGTGFELLKTIPAKGIAGVASNYSFTDKSPVNGWNYYRLTQVDNDGKATVYDVKSLSFILLKNPKVNITPNPVSMLASVSFAKGKYSKAELRDVNGRKLTTYVVGHSDEDLSVDVARLSPGIYFIRLMGIENTIHKLIKQ